jgi:hypothetical protein
MFITTVQGTVNYTISHLVTAAVGFEATLFITFWLVFKAMSLLTVRNSTPPTQAVTSAVS